MEDHLVQYETRVPLVQCTSYLPWHGYRSLGPDTRRKSEEPLSSRHRTGNKPPWVYGILYQSTVVYFTGRRSDQSHH